MKKIVTSLLFISSLVYGSHTNEWHLTPKRNQEELENRVQRLNQRIATCKSELLITSAQLKRSADPEILSPEFIATLQHLPKDQGIQTDLQPDTEAEGSIPSSPIVIDSLENSQYGLRIFTSVSRRESHNYTGRSIDATTVTDLVSPPLTQGSGTASVSGTPQNPLRNSSIVSSQSSVTPRSDHYNFNEREVDQSHKSCGCKKCWNGCLAGWISCLNSCMCS